MRRTLAAMLMLAAPTLGAQTGTLVASNMNDHTATVIDAASGRVLATVPTGEGPHEVAISHDGKWAVVSNYGVRGNVDGHDGRDASPDPRCGRRPSASLW